MELELEQLTREARFVSTQAVTVAVEGTDDEPVLTHVAPLFGVRSTPIAQVKRSGRLIDVHEEFLPGAFDEVNASGDDVLCVFDHKDGKVLGRRSAGTLRLWSDDVAQRYSVRLNPKVQYVRDLIENVRRLDIGGSSFLFRAHLPKDGGQEFVEQDGIILRRIRKVARLWHVGPVADPAYAGPPVELRSVPVVLSDIPDLGPGFEAGVADDDELERLRRRAKLLSLG